MVKDSMQGLSKLYVDKAQAVNIHENSEKFIIELRQEVSVMRNSSKYKLNKITQISEDISIEMQRAKKK